MRVLVLGGTWFLGRRVVERLHERGDEVLCVHRGRSVPEPWVRVGHLRSDRRDLTHHVDEVREFAPDAVLDTCALTGGDVDAVLPALPEVATVVLSSQDVYQAFAGLRSGRCESPVPLSEESELRGERYPYRGAGMSSVPDDYEKLDVEQRWRARGATVLRLPLIYGPHDWQRREDVVLRRIRAGRRRIPVGPGTLLWTKGHVEDVAAGVLAALDAGLVSRTFNLGETSTWPVSTWLAQIAGVVPGGAEFVRVPEEALPADLALTAAVAQHLLVSSRRAERELGWVPGDPEVRVAESVRWHLANPPDEVTWSAADADSDDAALALA